LLISPGVPTDVVPVSDVDAEAVVEDTAADEATDDACDATVSAELVASADPHPYRRHVVNASDSVMLMIFFFIILLLPVASSLSISVYSFIYMISKPAVL
jgi:hypothetical protein